MEAACSPLDPAMMAGVRAGNEAAFRTLFLAYFPRLAEYAAGFVDSREAAEDVAQEVLAEIWLKRAGLPDVTNLDGYVFRAVRNRALNLARHRKVRHRAQQALTFRTKTTVVPDDPVVLEEVKRAVLAAVQDLPPRTKEVFLLSRVHGLTYAAIASTLGISIKTVEALMGRALAAIRVRLPS